MSASLAAWVGLAALLGAGRAGASLVARLAKVCRFDVAALAFSSFRYSQKIVGVLGYFVALVSYLNSFYVFIVYY